MLSRIQAILASHFFPVVRQARLSIKIIVSSQYWLIIISYPVHVDHEII